MVVLWPVAVTVMSCQLLVGIQNQNSVSVQSWLCLIMNGAPKSKCEYIYFEMVAIQQPAILITFTIYSA